MKNRIIKRRKDSPMPVLFLMLLLLIPATVTPQSPLQFQYEKTITDFSNANEFVISPMGDIYVIDEGVDQILLLDTLGEVKRSSSGYGWEGAQMDNPLDVQASPLSVFVCDYGNNAIKEFDRGVNLLSVLKTNDGSTHFERPVSCAVSSFGELYVLDSENKRIVKYDHQRNFTIAFAGFDFGEFALKDPLKVITTDGQTVFVLDKNRLLVFDSFGNGRSIIPLPDGIKNIRYSGGKILFISNDEVLAGTQMDTGLQVNKIKVSGLPEKRGDIESAVLYGGSLYLLYDTGLIVARSK